MSTDKTTLADRLREQRHQRLIERLALGPEPGLTDIVTHLLDRIEALEDRLNGV